MKKILISLLVMSIIISPVFSKPDKEPKVTKGKKGDTGSIGEGLKDQYIGSIGVRLWDCQRHSGVISYGYDFNNKNNIFEAKIIVKFGKSYMDRELEVLENRLEKLEAGQCKN